MSMQRDRLRRFVLILGLVFSAVAAMWVKEQEAEDNSLVEVATHKSAPSAETRSQSKGLSLERLNQRTPSVSDIDPFRAKSWFVFVPPPEPPHIPPPEPTAPPLPFTYAGKSEDAGGGNLLVYLARGNESFAVKLGEKFDGVYQLEGIEKGSLVITFLPLSIKQRLPIGLNE